ncbi:mechanosensitive ion channel family protein [Micromonospora sp. NBC_01813]|uniref:mechanosensitive ion channel family protein n=1 Tax=Micromonospora sp. NBC_01813 TaxID=2975988 RepID=UPI002DD7E573|nr:mechanosensitive ion channel family protein [Micromonospora sp. NBC_01813]WSA10633.1 mechanosensitive ion channel family protein [Micromonospora sp. NBC_01813]
MLDEQVGRAVVAVIATVGGSFALTWLSGWGARLAARGRYAPFLTTLHRECHRPWGATLLVGGLLLAVPVSGVTGELRDEVLHILLLALIYTGAWLVIRILFVFEDTAFRRLPVDMTDNRRRRRARTQIGLLRRLTAVIIGIVALAATLMTFSQLRALGASLLASAGVAGVVAGLAAQSVLGHVFAGLQLAFSDELRLDDVVVVEQEWGRVEEIRLTYVVVRVWDQRRLILPTSYFTTTPFQNWTRNEAQVLGSVILHLDFTADIDVLRAEAHRIVDASPLWDRREWVVQVVDATETTICIRVLASAADAPSSWDLRCELREGLFEFLRRCHPDWLPRARSELSGPMEAEQFSTPHPAGSAGRPTIGRLGRPGAGGPDPGSSRGTGPRGRAARTAASRQFGSTVTARRQSMIDPSAADRAGG